MTALRITRGDERSYTLTALDAEGAPADLQDVDLWFTVKVSREEPDSEAIMQKTIGAGIVVDDPGSGLAVVTILPVDTNDLEFPKGRGRVFVWDLQSQVLGENPVTLDRGVLVVRSDVTRAYHL